MTFGWRRTVLGAMVAAIVCLPRLVSVAGLPAEAWTEAGQAGPEPTPQMSENVFKNIQVLKGIPADEFMDTMGMFASSLLFDCTSCHVQDILIKREAFAIATPRIERARQMIVMMNTINRTYFDGQQRVTCFTCHRGDNNPEVVPNLALQYGEVSEDPNSMRIVPDSRISADQVFSKYIQALGGAEPLSKLTSFIAIGTYEGFNTGNAKIPVEIFARAPDQRVQIVRTFEGDAVKNHDGRNAWAAEGWRQLPLMTLTGGNLAGARLEAIMSFPVGIQKAFSRWQASSAVIDDREVQVLQGSNAGELPVNFYFDESGLVVRMVRWSRTAVGTVPTQTDYIDYREVAGVRMPFRTVVTWTNGQNTIELREVRPNVPIETARFARPAPFRPR